MRTIRLHMTPLRQRMLEDMQRRNYSLLTIDCYLRCVANFALDLGSLPRAPGPGAGPHLSTLSRPGQTGVLRDFRSADRLCAALLLPRHPRTPRNARVYPPSPTALHPPDSPESSGGSRVTDRQSGVSDGGQDQSQWVGAEVTPSHRLVAAHLGPGREIAAVLTPHRFCRATHQWVIRTPKEKGGSQYAVLVTTLTDLSPVALADAYDGRAMIEATFCQDKQALGLGGTPPAQVGGSADGAAVGSPGPSCASMGQTVAQSGAYHAATAAGLWPGAVAPRCLGSPQSYPMAARVDGQCALLTPSPARNPSSGGLFYALSRACAGGVFALKPGNCARGARGCLGAGRARYPAR